FCCVSNSSFFFQAEDGIRDFHVTGVQTCALPIYLHLREKEFLRRRVDQFRLRNIETSPDNGPFIGNDQQVEEVLSEEEADDEGDEECAERPDEPRTQLDQVLDERLRLVFDITAHASSFGPSAFLLTRLPG